LATRGGKKHHKTVREALNSPRRGELAAEIDEAALDALIATSDDAVKTGRFLVSLAVVERPVQTSALGVKGLKKLQAPGREALLVELESQNPVARPRRLARMLMDMSNTTPPVPITYWDDATTLGRNTAVSAWREKLKEAGEL
jgi:hypothetical protein